MLSDLLTIFIKATDKTLMGKYLTFTIVTIFLTQTANAIDVSGCAAGVYCNIAGEYRPALVFGAGAQGIRSVQEGVTQNQDLVADILRYELTTDPDSGEDNIGNRVIASSVNKIFPVEGGDFLNPLPIAGIGYVLNPESFSTTTPSEAQLNRLTYPPRQSGSRSYSGIKIDNFSMKDIKIDFSNFAANQNRESKLKICTQVKLDLETSMAFNFTALETDYEVKIENIDLEIDTNRTQELCFNATIDMNNFTVSSLERIGNHPILTRQSIDKAFQKPGLKITLPPTTPLSSLDAQTLNPIARGYLTPVLGNPEIIKIIEAPIVTNVQEVLQGQLNNIVSSTLSNTNPSAMPEIKLPMFNIPNSSVEKTITEHIDALESMNGSSVNCKHFVNRMENVNYWIRQNPGFKSAGVAQKLNDFTSRVNPTTHRCKSRRGFSDALTNLKRQTAIVTPGLEETEELIVRQLNRINNEGDLAVEVFIPELCEGNYSSALAGREAPERCENFYSMIDLSYINNYIADQIEKGNVCQTHINGKCGIRMSENDGNDLESEEKPKFACEDMESIGLSGLGGANMRATISLKSCKTKGQSSLINLGLWRLGSFDNTDIQMSYDVKLSQNCDAGKPVCFKIDFREDLFSYQGDLEDMTLEGRVRSALIEEMNKLEKQFNEILNGFPIEDFTAGLEVSDFFGESASETSPGFLGACLKTSGESGSRAQVCLAARRLLPENHPSLLRYCAD